MKITLESTDVIQTIMRGDLSAKTRVWVGTIILDDTVMEALMPAATRRGIKPMELCNKILEVVADDDLVDGILDDLDEPKVSIASKPGTTTRVRYPGMPAPRVNPDNQNAHVVASVQDRHSRGAYKPMAREFREQGLSDAQS